jgi:hypothetical protein
MNMKLESAQKAVALIKFFSEEEHYLAFKNGGSILRTPHFFRTHEGLGRGDRSESCLGYWDIGLGDRMPNLVVDGRPVDMKNFQSILIYPAHEQQDAWLQSWSVLGPHNSFEQSLERMLEEFGTYFVVLPANKIRAYVKLMNKASGSQVHYGFVQYSSNPSDRSLTVKDSSFAYQKEFRFYVGACEKNEIECKKLQMKGLGKILLEAVSLKLKSPSGEIKYCSLGRQEVVTA